MNQKLEIIPSAELDDKEMGKGKLSMIIDNKRRIGYLYNVLYTVSKQHVSTDIFHHDILLCGGKQWQTTPKNLPRMQCARATPGTGLCSGSCQPGL